MYVRSVYMSWREWRYKKYILYHKLFPWISKCIDFHSMRMYLISRNVMMLHMVNFARLLQWTSARTCVYMCTLIYTLRSKGAKWHLLGFFGLSLYWHPQKVLQRTLLEGSLERTLLRTLISVYAYAIYEEAMNHKIGLSPDTNTGVKLPCVQWGTSLVFPENSVTKYVYFLILSRSVG